MLQRAHQVDGDGARGLLAIGGLQVAAQLARPDLAVLARDMAAQEPQIARLPLGGRRDGRRRQFDVQGLQLFVNAHR
jgi:hypothetical protein